MISGLPPVGFSPCFMLFPLSSIVFSSCFFYWLISNSLPSNSWLLSPWECPWSSGTLWLSTNSFYFPTQLLTWSPGVVNGLNSFLGSLHISFSLESQWSHLNFLCVMFSWGSVCCIALNGHLCAERGNIFSLLDLLAFDSFLLGPSPSGTASRIEAA